MMLFFNMNIYEDDRRVIVSKQETARSTKRRQKKPWAKPIYRTVTRPDPMIIQTPDGIICHPSIAYELRKQL
jgi:hypothetical protein